MPETCSAPSGQKPFSFGIDPWTLAYVVVPSIALAPIAAFIMFPFIMRGLGSLLGLYLRKKTEGRRAQLLELMNAEQQSFKHSSKKSAASNRRHVQAQASGSSEKNAAGWAGVVGFFHPFCNAGGGGERVLWAAIKTTQERYPNALCVVYTGDHEVNKQAMLARVKTRFNIDLHPPSVNFLYLSTRHLVLASTWPHFTLLGQSLGSVVLAWDAFQLLVPDIFIDTMGYAFSLGLSKLLFRRVPTCAYVHYPTISTDMLESLDPKSITGTQGVNAGKGVGIRGKVKKFYWKMFAALYSRVGSTVNVVMTNSTWTQGHVQRLWGPYRQAKARNYPIAVNYPPCAVEELEEAVEVSEASEKKREKALVYIAQFRPEKNHTLIIQSFAEFLNTKSEAAKDAKLVLIGSVRDDHDSKRVYTLRLLVNELGIKDRVEFHLDASWPEILDWLQRASVGVNGMWNEHFGIGVVEYQAAGLVSVVHDSGGPKLDIVIKIDGEPTGFHATNVKEFAEGYEKALSIKDALPVRLRARQSAKRFTESEFDQKWIAQMEKLVALTA
ncbi:GDP-Man:Man(3)GlcNAc(2)-PP-Dol alpha-1,2-mannosyltransferase [Colletotrichum tanaceti]|uniref:GDP-Man:Man(3)GlcNAc(2)-PP-Dol alpha-1,2-mannosyltransferase n=1 Tax=Colletotrichum tanaceti TaxID=1306861 RepID=A0A4U6XU27_9PEZI|nr:GDP-Man:Man(3)GlcNAc(2)-PP-Dol alpha-1,2-mannosyltransferase [Colletotrichum tanaceti]KAJ0169097.1 GDP-Man:Man(3)GlcNAc(2)-PP-Dol alpha-1,2-mannosyltransferase [Colletotrichum tanaceti]TKW59432.1 GDP-Man:Man(3)GlcNAc(2)-PP-Dol alpha-1,2-mannosyltransferase [Colletotrichum tanaceti]